MLLILSVQFISALSITTVRGDHQIKDSGKCISKDSLTYQEAKRYAEIETMAKNPNPENEQLIKDVINTGVAVMNATNNPIIPGMENEYAGGLIAGLVLGIIRFFEKRRRERKTEEMVQNYYGIPEDKREEFNEWKKRQKYQIFRK